MKQRKVPVRTCVSCKTSDDKRSLIRIVRDSAGSITLDSSGKKAGRGAYLCGRAECLNRALKEKRLSRALRADIPEETVEMLRKIIEQGPDDM